MSKKISKSILFVLICSFAITMSSCGSETEKGTTSSNNSTKVESTQNKEVVDTQANEEPQKPSVSNKNSETTKKDTKTQKNSFIEYDNLLNNVLAFNLGEFSNPSEIDKSELLYFAQNELLNSEPIKYDPVDKNAGTYYIPEKDIQDVIYKYFGIKDFKCNEKSYNSSKKIYEVVNDGIGCTISWKTIEAKLENDLIVLKVDEINDANNEKKSMSVSLKKNGSNYNLISVKYVK